MRVSVATIARPPNRTDDNTYPSIRQTKKEPGFSPKLRPESGQSISIPLAPASLRLARLAAMLATHRTHGRRLVMNGFHDS